jgi:hypothetical protein
MGDEYLSDEEREEKHEAERLEKINDSLEKIGLTDDDIVGQVKEVGKATLDIGKKTLSFGLKTGKLLFNAARLGVGKIAQNYQQKTDAIENLKLGMQGKSPDELNAIINSDASFQEKVAAKQLLSDGE